MKICIVSDYLPYMHDNWSGAELVASKTGKVLSSMGHDISYIVLSADKKTSANNTYFVNSPLKKLPFLAKNFPIDIASILRISSILNKLKPDVVHIQAKFLFFPCVISSLLLKIPYFFTVLDYYNLCPRNILLRKNGELCQYYHGKHCSDCVAQSNRKSIKLTGLLFPNFLKKPLFVLRRKIMDFFMFKAAKIITFSETSKNRLLSYGYKPDKVEVVYHYAFEDIAQDKADSGDKNNKKILFVGTITYHKGLHILVEAMKEVAKAIPDVKLLVAGSGNGSYRDSILKEIKENNLSANIEFIGHKDNKEILGLMKEVNLVVVPEQWYSEFGPVILIEAKLSAKPVVASRIGSIPEYVRDRIDGVLSEYNLAGGFSQAILGLLKDKDKTLMLGNSSSERLREISDTKKSFSTLEKLYSYSIG